MTTQKKKKSAKEKKVLIGSVVVAAAIVAGSTFAWFSSKDEVTNRLTASADYNVSIVEDFQPPKEWIPGQTVNKDVAAVNTGNVDAFVRMWLDGQMRLLSEQTSGGTDVTGQTPNFTAVTDAKKKAMGLNYSVGTTYYKTLSTKQIDNPNDEAHQTSVNEETNQPAAFSEVQSMQAAGVLVYAPTDASYTWTLEQATEMTVIESTNTNIVKNLPKETAVGSPKSNAATKIAATANDGNYYGAIDASTFVPQTTGLYLFRRNIGDTADGTANAYEYSGYYFVKQGEKGVTADTYFALRTEEGANGHSDYVIPKNSVTEPTSDPSKDLVLPVTPKDNSIFLFSATEEVLKDQLTWAYNSNAKKFTVTKAGATDDKNIVIEIALHNIDTNSSEAWTAILDNNTTPSKATTFYYNNDVEAGDTTTKLVDSVTLSKDTQVGAYLAFDFDLDVFMDSVQVTMDGENGIEGYTSVTAWEATSGNTKATGADNGNRTVASEIEKITWTK